MKAIGVAVMTQTAITFPLSGSCKSLHCGIEWENMLCYNTPFYTKYPARYTEGLKYGDNKGHYITV